METETETKKHSSGEKERTSVKTIRNGVKKREKEKFGSITFLIDRQTTSFYLSSIVSVFTYLFIDLSFSQLDQY